MSAQPGVRTPRSARFAVSRDALRGVVLGDADAGTLGTVELGPTGERTACIVDLHLRFSW